VSDLNSNIEKLQNALAPFKNSGVLNQIGGKSVPAPASSAFGLWRDMPAANRKKILLNVADAIEQRAEEIALCECWDTGQAFRFMSKAALRGAENFRFFADQVSSARDGMNLPSPTLMNITTRVPIGPVGIITPWNTPFMLSTWKIAPALAAGCTVVHKPAELSPLTARLLMDIATESHRLCWRKPYGYAHRRSGRSNA